jgi:dienelactone hydrolase
MVENYPTLGSYHDWPGDAFRRKEMYPSAPPGLATQQKIRELLGYQSTDENPQDVHIERHWERDGLVGEEVSWWVGYGPRTSAWVLKPADVSDPLPGVVALHDHGSHKYYGKEKVADGPEGPIDCLEEFRAACYGGQPFANALAKAGFMVLVHDTFLWGSRRFELDSVPAWIRSSYSPSQHDIWPDPSTPEEIARYNFIMEIFENWVERYCMLLGTTLAGIISFEDRVAINYLRSRSDVLPDGTGCVGLSGGGCRAALLQATCDSISAAVIVGMMSTYEALIERTIDHTWMLFPGEWARYGDWPDLAACRAPSPLLVQYDLDDGLFTERGMRTAHEKILGHYQSVSSPKGYTGQFYPGPHKFDLEMQAAAFDWLKKQLLGK